MRGPRGASRGARGRGPAALLLLLAGLLAGVAAAAAAPFEVLVAAPGDSLSAGSPAGSTAGPGLIQHPESVYAPGDTLVAAFRLTGALPSEDTTLGEGIPATLTLVVDLWRARGGWWDSLVHTEPYLYRFRRDVWSGRYELLDPAGNAVVLRDREALRAYLERVHEVPLGVPAGFERGKHYYLTVRAALKPLDLEDLEAVNSWLSGDVTQGSGGGILGFPKALAELARDLSGLGDRSALGRSRDFTPRPER